MPDWLQSNFDSDLNLSAKTLIVRQLCALLLGIVVACIYRASRGEHFASGNGSQSRAIMVTLVLLTVLIGMIGSVIGDNVARAFALVGALSIVRFRTVVDDTRDTAFVIFAVAVGMAVGAGYLKVALVSMPVVTVAAFLFRPGRPMPPRDHTLMVRTDPGFSDDGSITRVLDTHVSAQSLTGITTARQGALVDRTYAITLKPETATTPLVLALHALPGVQGVEMDAKD